MRLELISGHVHCLLRASAALRPLQCVHPALCLLCCAHPVLRLLCLQCGTQVTPVWRAGPAGPKTLCNACGVRYMKTAKRKT